MNDISVKAIKFEAELAIEKILSDLRDKGVEVFRLQVFKKKNTAPQVNIVVDEQGGVR
tara:strand:+ start:274 stop:447 length:174 start_codon:yes stop_codon:yes gene_type:complete